LPAFPFSPSDASGAVKAFDLAAAPVLLMLLPQTIRAQARLTLRGTGKDPPAALQHIDSFHQGCLYVREAVIPVGEPYAKAFQTAIAGRQMSSHA
jgi:hypothetical protein